MSFIPADSSPCEARMIRFIRTHDLMSENLNDVSMFDAIERISGLRPATAGRQRIEAVRATAEQAQLLNLSLGEPLLYLNAYFHDQYDHPLCIGRQYYIGSRYMFEF